MSAYFGSQDLLSGGTNATIPSAGASLLSYLGPIGAIGGGVLSGLGGILGASQQNRAARQARDFVDRDQLGQQSRLAGSLYGAQAGYLPTLTRLMGQAQQRGDRGEAERLSRETQSLMNPAAGSILGRMGMLTSDIANQQGSDLAQFDATSDRLSRLYGQARDTLAGTVARASGLAAGAEGMAASSGVGRERLIRRDAAKQRTAMDQRTRGQLAASGFSNSTALPAAMAENARSVGEQQDNALQAARDSRVAAMLGARGQRINTTMAGAGQVYDASRTAADADTTRQAQRLGLTQAQLANLLSLRLMPIQTELGVQQGSIFNPSNSSAQYYPGASGAGNALSSFGNSVSSGAGMLAALQMLGRNG